MSRKEKVQMVGTVILGGMTLVIFGGFVYSLFFI